MWTPTIALLPGALTIYLGFDGGGYFPPATGVAVAALAIALGPKGANKDGSLSSLIEDSARQLDGQGQQLHDTLHLEPIGDYAQFIDVPSFIDYLIVNELTRNVDAYVRSAYYHKDRDGKLISAVEGAKRIRQRRGRGAVDRVAALLPVDRHDRRGPPALVVDGHRYQP